MDSEKRKAQKRADYHKHKEVYLARGKKWRKENPERAKESRNEWNKNNVIKMRKFNKTYLSNLKHQILEAYCEGDIKCLCCGEVHEIMLSVDHINRDNVEHRKREGIGHTSKSLYLWLRRNNYPTGFRILCLNCNTTLGSIGTCPHSNLTQPRI